MSIKTRIAAVAVAALAATGSIIASTTTSAEAKGFHPGWGIGAGLVGAAIVGSAIAATTYPTYGYRCGWVRQYDAFGRYVGSVNTCD